MKLKVMSYNILTGFCDWNFDPNIVPLLNKKRLENAKNLIEKENPDILCLLEAYFTIKDPLKIVIDYQKIFNYPYSAIGHTNIVLSKFPIISSKVIGSYVKREEGGSGLISLVDAHGKRFTVAILHPSISVREAVKTEFVKKALKEFTGTAIITGDLNAIDKDDKYTKQWEENFEKKVLDNFSFEKKLKNNKEIIQEMLTSQLIQEIKQKGYKDTFKLKNKSFNFTIPTNLLSKDKSTGVRIDYIFTSPDIEVLQAGIIKNKLTEQASDHYPVYATLEI